MTSKHYYVTVEVTLQLSSEMSKNTPENMNEIRRRICDSVYNGYRKVDYNCHIYNETIMSIIDEKGNEL